MQLAYYGNNIILKVVHPSDARQVLDFYARNQEHFNRWEPDRPKNFYTEAFQRAELTSEMNLFLKHASCRFYVYLRHQPETIVGCVCLSHIVRSSFQSAHVAYKTDAAYVRRGISREAMELLFQIAFDEAGLHRLTAYIHPDNQPSIAFAEALHFQKEGIAHDFIKKGNQWIDHLVYARWQ